MLNLIIEPCPLLTVVLNTIMNESGAVTQLDNVVKSKTSKESKANIVVGGCD